MDARHTCRHACRDFAQAMHPSIGFTVLAVGENDSRQDTILDTQVIAEQTIEHGTQVGCGLQVAILE